ncbi:MAG: hypothetical protein HRU15_09800 [Planctomycetes bacterium]|nr:hypothetical protein [Planctomycetota bacterium]
MIHFRCLLLIAVITALHAADPVYVEDKGLIVIQAERALLAQPGIESKFEVRTDLAGYSGDGYLYWNGGDHYQGVAGNDILRYRLMINTPGRYQLRFYVSSQGAERNDLNNDAWLRMDEDKWYKIYKASIKGFSWGGNFDNHAQGKPPAFYDLSAGEHILQLAGRSHGFHIDRIHLFLDSRASDALSISLPETSGIPLPPENLDNQQLRQAWLAGQLGYCWTWAEKQERAEISKQLGAYFNEDLAEIATGFSTNPIGAWNKLKLFSERWVKAPKGALKQIKDLKKKWSKDKGFKEELKAQKIVETLLKLRRQNDQQDNIKQGENLLMKKYLETRVAQTYAKQYIQ